MTNAHQPEAMRLAASLELCWGDSRLDEAAAELRRLHAVEQQRDELLAENKLLQAAGYGSGRLQSLRDQRDKLREALTRLVDEVESPTQTINKLGACIQARSAIAETGDQA